MMKNCKPFAWCAFCAMLLMACENDNQGDAQTCDQRVVIDANLFDTAPTDDLSIHGLERVGDCLEITYSSGGCDGTTWELKLIDSGAILESFPPQRNLIFSLKNEELCEAVITRTLTVDISQLKTDSPSVQLNIVNTGDEMLYEYGS